ncbi:MAG: hypothetical protein U1F68_09720 [Gammaproteobacteria bacterium]
MPPHQRFDDRKRILLAQECAKILAEEGIKDYLLAKRKAAARLGLSTKTALPTNAEIEQALIEYQRLFKSSQQPLELHSLRMTALEAMRFLERFQPRLVGPVLTGTAAQYSEVNLHLFADTTEEIMIFLMDRCIRFESSQRRLRVSNGEYINFPVIVFSADGVTVDLTIFPQQFKHESPRSPVDGRPMQRANFVEVQEIVAQREKQKEEPISKLPAPL